MTDSSAHPYLPSGRPGDALHRSDDGCFAVGPGDAEQFHFFGGAVVKPVGDFGGGAARVVHLDL